MAKHDNVIEYLKENGPSHPVQVGKVLESDIFTSSAILQEMIDEKRIKKTEKKVGGSPLYYLEGQEKKARKMVEESLKPVEKKVLKDIKEKGFIYQKDLDPQARYILRGLKDLVMALRAKIKGEERIIWKYYSVDNEVIEKEILSNKEEKKETKNKEPEEKKQKPKKEEKKKEQREFDDLDEVIEKLGAKIINKNKKRRTEINYVIQMGSLPKQKYLLKHRKKKRINDSDLSLLYTEVMEKKMPGIMVTSGKLTRKAKKKKKEFGDLVFVLKT